MRKVDLIWKKRVTRKARAAIIKWTEQHYDEVEDRGDRLRIMVPDDCTKFIWIFMLSKTFSDFGKDEPISTNRKETQHAPPKEKANGAGAPSRRKAPIPRSRKRR